MFKIVGWNLTIKIKIETIKIILIVNPLNAGINPACHLVALLGAHHILHISSIKVKCQPKILNILTR